MKTGLWRIEVQFNRIVLLFNMQIVQLTHTKKVWSVVSNTKLFQKLWILKMTCEVIVKTKYPS